MKDPVTDADVATIKQCWFTVKTSMQFRVNVVWKVCKLCAQKLLSYSRMVLS